MIIHLVKITFQLLVLHSPDGREIDVSRDEITSLQCKIPGVDNKLFAHGVSAMVNLTDGKFVSVTETCLEIREMIEGHSRKRDGE